MKVWSYILSFLLSVVPCLTQAGFFENTCPPTSINGAGVTFETAFTPDDKLSELVVRTIHSAQKSVKVMAHRFISKEVSLALMDMIKKGKDVQILLDKHDQDDGNSSAGFFVTMSHPPYSVMHYENQYGNYIIIDDKDLVVGNITAIASAGDEKKNAAEVLVIHNAPELAMRYEQNWQELSKGSEKVKNMNLIRIKNGKEIRGE